MPFLGSFLLKFRWRVPDVNSRQCLCFFAYCLAGVANGKLSYIGLPRNDFYKQLPYDLQNTLL